MSTTPPNPSGTPPASTPPAAPEQAPAQVQYVRPEQMAQVQVDGRKMDVPVADLVRKYQVGSAAEQRLQQANQMADRYRSDLDAVQRIRTLASSNPQAALEEARRSLGLQLPPKASDNPQGEPDPDPQTTRIMSELSALKAQLAGMDQFREQVVTNSVTQEIAAAVRSMPLYAADPNQAARAERFVAAYLQANPQASIREVAGLVHADDVEFVQRQIQQTRDQRAGNVQQLASVPPSSGTPGLSQIPEARMTPAELKAQSSRGAFSRIINEARKMAGG